MTAKQNYQVEKIVDWVFKVAVPSGLVMISTLTAKVEDVRIQQAVIINDIETLHKQQDKFEQKFLEYDKARTKFFQEYELKKK